MAALITKIARTARRVSESPRGADVHFHQGPQGQPTPCYDARCNSPRLSL
jgi:hypothetical protein